MPEKLKRILVNYYEHRVGRNAASLAYYLLFAMFPLLIFISNLLGRLELDIAAVTKQMQTFLPTEVVKLITAYLEHVSVAPDTALFWFSLIFTVYFPMRATKSMMDDVRTAYRLEKPVRPVLYLIRQLVFTVIWLVVIMLVLTSLVMGQKLLMRCMERIPALQHLEIPFFFVRFWHYMRFPALGVIMLAALVMLYAMAQDKKQPVRTYFPGAAFATAGWLAVSIGFSFYVENFANYSMIYGTLGAVIMLLLWLYLTAVILILGAEYNAVAVHGREEGRRK